MTKTGTNLQGIKFQFFSHLMFSHWRGKSYTAMQETEYCYSVDMNSRKLNRKVLCVCRLLFFFFFFLFIYNFVVLHLKMPPHLQMNNNKITDEQQQKQQQQQLLPLQKEQSTCTQYFSVHL